VLWVHNIILVSTPSSDVWVFGYGSLLWHAGFQYQQKVVGYVEGYCRRFWQGSERSKGLPGALGRVVTIVEDPKVLLYNESAWGLHPKATAKIYGIVSLLTLGIDTLCWPLYMQTQTL
jgi:hypothetical protein